MKSERWRILSRSPGSILCACSFGDDQEAKPQVALAVSDSLNAARIEHGWPIYGLDFSDANLPQEIARDPYAISFTKGCYLGQETVARLDALGQVQKKMVLLQISGDTLPKSKPDPLPLRHAAEHFGVPPETCLLVGDSISDVKAARAAGFQVVCVSYGYNQGMDLTKSHPDVIIDAFHELPNLIEFHS